MRNLFMEKILKCITFTVAALASALLTSTVFHHQVGRSIVGILLLAFLLVAILYACSWYLRKLWAFSGHFSKVAVGKVSKSENLGVPSVEQA